MSLKFRNILRITIVLMIGFSVFISFRNTPVIADELSDLNQQILQKQKEKEETLKKISAIDANIKSIASAQGSLYSKLSNYESQKKNLETQIKSLEAQTLDQEKVLKEYFDKLVSKEDEIKEMTNYLYKLSFTQPDSITNDRKKISDFVMESVQTNATIEIFKKDIKDYKNKIKEIEELKINIQKEKELVAATKANVEEQIKLVKVDIQKYEKDLAAARKEKGSLISRTTALGQELELLSAQQKAIVQRQQQLLLAASLNGGTKPIITGEIYFNGRGRDVKQGHGVGMSQYGAVGAALKGWSSTQILEFYYPGAKLVDMGTVTNVTEIDVQGFGKMDINKYVSGLGEVPSISCEDSGQSFNVSDPYNSWHCWPKEVIKAQVIAARTYAVRYAIKNSSICITQSCQVYNGGEAKKWASDATSNMILVYDNKPITAVYSSDNNQGYGTANNDTVWSNYNGNGTVYPYLRGVNDSAFALKTYWSNYQWRTNGYKLEDIDKMVAFAANGSYEYSSFFKEIQNSIGNITDIKLEKDSSNRVKKVTLYGAKGNRSISGWLFKGVWTDWTASRCSSNKSIECDYIFSITFDINIKQ